MCDDVIYGYHIHNGQLITRQCTPAMAATGACNNYIWLNDAIWYVAKPYVPEGLVYRDECAAVPV